MRISINPKAEAQRLLMMRNPFVEEERAVAPMGLSPSMEFKPHIYAGGYGTDSDKETFITEAHGQLGIASIKITGMSGKTEEAQPNDRINNMLLSNRPDFYPDGSSNPSTKCAGFRTKSGKTPNEISISPIMLEQTLLTSGSLYTHGGSGKREDDSIGTLFAVIPGPALHIAMKPKGVTELNLRREMDSSWYRKSLDQDVGKNVGWADYYTRGATSEPDAPQKSMNYQSMWENDAPCCALYPMSNYTGKNGHGWTKKAKNRTVEREDHGGKGGVESDEFQSIINDSLDYGSPAYTALAGSVATVSSDSAQASEDDTQSTLMAAGPSVPAALMLQAAQLSIRNYAISLWTNSYKRAQAGSNRCACVSWGAEITFEKLWFEEKWDVDKLEWLKAYLYRLEYNPTGHNIGSSYNITTKRTSPGNFTYGKLSAVLLGGETSDAWSAVEGTKASSKGVQLKLSGSLAAFMGNWMCTELDFNDNKAWLTHNYVELADQLWQATRPLVGEPMGSSGKWTDRAQGKLHAPALLFSSITTLPFGAFLPYKWISGPHLTTSGLYQDIEKALPLLVANTAWLGVGSALGAQSNLCTGFFEDEVEDDVSDWDDGDAFFCFFWSTIRS